MPLQKPKLQKKFAASKHPLIVGLLAATKKRGVSLRAIAINDLKVTQQSLHGWMVEAVMTVKERRAKGLSDVFEMPPKRVPDLCRATGQRPHVYYPDLWHRDWKF